MGRQHGLRLSATAPGSWPAVWLVKKGPRPGRSGTTLLPHPYPDMSLFPDMPPPASPPAKPKITAEERRRRDADRLKTIRLRLAIGRELDDRGITTPVEIGVALGMPPAEATKLLTRHQWREGDIEQLEAA